MILWLTLFLLIIGISFILALRSMKDYQEIPRKSDLDYGLFLIRRPGNFDTKLLDSIRELVLLENAIISFERVFKGRQSALTIFGPKTVLDKFTRSLDLLELEDYTSALAEGDISVWEVGEKERGELTLPELSNEDQFFWQVVVGKDQTQIRAALYCNDPVRRKTLAAELQNLNARAFVKIPRPFSNEQMLGFYRTRSLGKDSKRSILNSEEIVSLLRIQVS